MSQKSKTAKTVRSAIHALKWSSRHGD